MPGGEAGSVIEATGIERRHICDRYGKITTSDLCFQAASKLIAELGWDKESVDAIGYCTQTPDYLNHPTGFLVHERLGLPETCMVFDYYHGCPGWVTSLANLASMLGTGSIHRAILLDGDEVSVQKGANDREGRPLFGDAGSATALEYQEGSVMQFNVGTRSSEGRALINRHGGCRCPWTLETLKADLDRRAGLIPLEQGDGMDSMDVFSFGITKVPKAIKRLCENFGIDLNNVDRLVLHQANRIMLEKIVRKLKFDMAKVPMSLRNYGNTTSVSIPLTIAASCREAFSSGKVRTIACGFGTGLAYGAVYFETDSIAVPEVMVYNEDKNNG